jgi:hypothetical protein
MANCSVDIKGSAIAAFTLAQLAFWGRDAVRRNPA